MLTWNCTHLPLLLGVLALAGCAGTGDSLSRTFGLTHAAPDEFTVTTRAPLSMPPNFDLRPPQPGVARPQEQNATQGAEAALSPQSVLAPATAAADSAGQQALLQAAGPAAPADIRAKVNADAARDRDGQYLTDQLMFWKEPPPPGTVVDPQKEAQRLNQNAAMGQAPVTGETPIIRRKSGNFLDTLF